MYKIAGMKNWFWYTLIVAFVCGLIAGFLWEQSDIAGYISIAGSLFSGIVAIVAAYKLPRKFGWGVFASILYVLFTGICLLILGFGSSKYEGKEEKTVVEA
jgi:energy-coupling factor transporter transmembrane protein EcfT